MRIYQWPVCLLLLLSCFQAVCGVRDSSQDCLLIILQFFLQTRPLPLLLCARLLCVPGGFGWWQVLTGNQRWEDRATSKYCFLPDSLPGSDFSQLRSCMWGAPAQWALSHSHSSCPGPVRHREVSHCGWFPALHLPFWLPYGWLLLCKQSFSLNALQSSPLFPAITLINDEVVRKTEFVCTQM